MHILGLCNGSINGNSEILLKAALKVDTAIDSSLTVSWIHVPSVVLPRQHVPFRSDPSLIPHRHDGRDRHPEGETLTTVRQSLKQSWTLMPSSLLLRYAVTSFLGTLKALMDA